MLATLSNPVGKMLFYEALTCSFTLGICDSILILIDPFFQKKSIRMIFGCGDCFTSRIGRYLLELREIIIRKENNLQEIVLRYLLYFLEHS